MSQRKEAIIISIAGGLLTVSLFELFNVCLMY